MPNPQDDTRSADRRALDEALAEEEQLPPLVLPEGRSPAPMEAFLPAKKAPLAAVGIVENGVIRLLDPLLKLPERSRVIVVASDGP